MSNHEMSFSDAAAIVHRALNAGVIRHDERSAWEARLMRNPAASRQLDDLAARVPSYDEELEILRQAEMDAKPRPERPQYPMPVATASGLAVEALRHVPAYARNAVAREVDPGVAHDMLTRYSHPSTGELEASIDSQNVDHPVGRDVREYNEQLERYVMDHRTTPAEAQEVLGGEIPSDDPFAERPSASRSLKEFERRQARIQEDLWLRNPSLRPELEADGYRPPKRDAITINRPL